MNLKLYQNDLKSYATLLPPVLNKFQNVTAFLSMASLTHGVMYYYFELLCVIVIVCISLVNKIMVKFSTQKNDECFIFYICST